MLPPCLLCIASFGWNYLLPQYIKLRTFVRGVRKEVHDFKAELERIQTRINRQDRMAEEEEEEEEGDKPVGIKATVKRLRDAAFDIETVIDDYMIFEDQHPRDPRCDILPGENADFCQTMKTHLQIANKINDIKLRVAKNKQEDLQIKSSSKQGSSSSEDKDATLHDLRRTPFDDLGDEIVGFEDLKSELDRWMLKVPQERPVISLVGMGGQGKTTLAYKAFNSVIDDNLRFKECIKDCRSSTVNGLLSVWLKKIYKSRNETLPADILEDGERLRVEVRRCLFPMRYVVLFDDVRDELFFDSIQFALPKNKMGSRIIITTRDMRVASCCKKHGNSHVFEMQPLTPEKSLELFLQKAGTDLNDKGLSSDIVKKCEGLPVALVAIGQYLRRDEDQSIDERISNWSAFSRDFSKELENNSHLTAIIKYLDSSYHDLLYRLKQCFLYFGIYPQVESKRLIRQWIAEGFVKYETGETLEQTAEKYLKELIARNLVQKSSVASNGKKRICRVHGLVHEMILQKIAYSSFCHFVRGNSDQSMIRRLTIATNSNNLIETVERPNMRSLHILTDQELPEQFVESIPKLCTRLKVLDFEDVPLSNVPKYLGDLLHLRYLSFRNTKVKNLPRSIGTLHQLETLDLRQTMVREVPKEINNLKKLRHLLAYHVSRGVRHGIQMNGGIGALASLQTLRKVETDHGGVELIKELERLSQLRELGLTHVKREFTSALCSSISKMPHLEKLNIAAKGVDEVIDLQFHPSPSELKKLRLIGKLDPFPNWVPELRNLVKLSLSYSKLTHDSLASLQHMPQLLYLNIHYRAYEDKCLHFRGEGFQKLQQLVLNCLDNLDCIVIATGALPSLKKFTLVNIPQLKAVPLGIYNLPKLEVHIMDMSDEFVQSIDRDWGQQTQQKWIIEQVQVPSARIV